MRPKSDKPRLIARDPAEGYTSESFRSARTPDGDHFVPEPEAVAEHVAETMAVENRARFEALKREELEEQKRRTTIDGLNREWKRAIAAGRQCGGTFHFGDFKKIWLG